MYYEKTTHRCQNFSAPKQTFFAFNLISEHFELHSHPEDTNGHLRTSAVKSNGLLQVLISLNGMYASE